jgi:peptidoglycan hydrolase-like protein with peptidoglycan-binding domain
MIRVGDKNDTVRAVQHLLQLLGYVALVEDRSLQKLFAEPLIIDGTFGPQTELALMDFQRDQGVLVDGVLGPQTMSALEDAYTRHNLEMDSPGPDALAGFNPVGQPITEAARGAAARRVAFIRVDTNNKEAGKPRPGYLAGFPALQLRADIAERYKAARDELNRCGGWFTSSGGKRALDSPVTIGRSSTSMHFLGRAFDLYVYSGMVDPAKDSYIVEIPPEGRKAIAYRDDCFAIIDDKEAAKRSLENPGRWSWRIWARCEGEGSENVPVVKIENVATYLDYRGERTAPVEGRFVDLTTLMAKHGFKPGRPHPRFFDFRGDPIYADWWHFRCEDGLIPRVSTFGGELLRIYSETTLAGTSPWEERHKVFGDDWD